ncbi:MAG TPA: CoA ester lyase [Propionibacterium sp.]|jgi:citrate lyase subunit beta/citryl-CoA lyase|nr:CoA ester lyase [Propionibacterium sp.]
MTWYPPGPALLFCPGDRPDRFGKALDRADAAILDLEDAVASVDKERARAEVARAELDPDRTIVRISQTSSPGHADDVAAVRAGGYRCVMLSKSESGDQIRQVAEVIDGVVLALVETPLGVVRANDIAEAEGCVGLMWGSEDLIAAMGGTASRFAYLHAGPGQVPGAYRDVARHARSVVALAAAAFGRWAVDAVRMDIRDEGGLLAEARDAAALGFAATACIHPTQAAIVRRAYEPTEEQVDWARRVLAAAEDGERVVRVDGHMVDGPMFRQAEAILRRIPA